MGNCRRPQIPKDITSKNKDSNATKGDKKRSVLSQNHKRPPNPPNPKGPIQVLPVVTGKPPKY